MYSIFKKTNTDGFPIYYLDNTNSNSLIDFISKKKAHDFLVNISNKYNLCEKLNGIDKINKSCFKYQLKICFGACIKKEPIHKYEKRFKDSFSDLIKLPDNCTLFFKYNDLITYVNIHNNQAVEFGVDGKTKYRVNYTSYDEIKIINNYQRKFPERMLKIKAIS